MPRHLARDDRLEDVRVAHLAHAAHRPFLFQAIHGGLHRRVSWLRGGKAVLDLANRRIPARPERLENPQFEPRQSGWPHGSVRYVSTTCLQDLLCCSRHRQALFSIPLLKYGHFIVIIRDDGSGIDPKIARSGREGISACRKCGSAPIESADACACSAASPPEQRSSSPCPRTSGSHRSRSIRSAIAIELDALNREASRLEAETAALVGLI